MQKKNLERVCALPMFAGVGIADVRHVLEESFARARTFRRRETVFAILLGVHRTALSRTLAQLVASGQLACRKNVFMMLKKIFQKC